MSNREIKAKRVYSNELEKLQADPAHYMTPGARRYFTRIWIGYVILAVAFCAGIWGITNKVDNNLRDNLNSFIVLSCKNSIPVQQKFNAALKADIEIQKDAKKINIEHGQTARAALNDRAIKFKTASLLDVPTPKECEERGNAF